MYPHVPAETDPDDNQARSVTEGTRGAPDSEPLGVKDPTSP